MNRSNLYSYSYDNHHFAKDILNNLTELSRHVNYVLWPPGKISS